MRFPIVLGLVLVLVMAAGCRQIFGLTSPTLADTTLDGQPGEGLQGPDATLCYGSFTVVCFDTLPTQALSVPNGMTVTLDTTNPSTCDLMLPSGECVHSATTIDVAGALNVIGSRPLVLVAMGNVSISGLVEAGSRSGGAKGPGNDDANCTSGTQPTTTAGGAGATFAGVGGSGGGGASGSDGGGPGAAVHTVSSLRGGCRGQAGTGANVAAGGDSGGAIDIVSGIGISVTGNINAGGAGGHNGVFAAAGASGGGGGGSGGMIVLDSAMTMIESTARVTAHGGGGGEGSSTTANGHAGYDSNGSDAALGGAGNVATGGDGGTGSFASPDPTAGQAGSVSGGGGGGGWGVIDLVGSPVVKGFVSPYAPPA